MAKPQTESAEVLTSHREPPSWYDELGSALSYSDHIVLSGNTRDLYPSPCSQSVSFLDLEMTLWELLKSHGFRALLHFDPIAGLRVQSASTDADLATLERADLPFGQPLNSMAQISAIHSAVADFTEFPVVLLFSYASHFHGNDKTELDDCLVAIDRKSRELRQGSGIARSNPTIWIVDHPADLPDWFALQNASLREVQLELPNLEDRYFFGRHLSEANGWINHVPTREQERSIQQFALECDSRPLLAMQCVARVAMSEGYNLTHISDAVSVFRTGARRNPWTSPVLRQRMKRASEILGARIKGQQHALDKTLDILARSILGLSGAQSGAMHTRPRGALFLVGPTGVGKTELAKAVTELLFGDESACHRFDMSEFMEENSVTRLIGASPGHQGHEKGGQLTNAVNRRPFSVFLFDEVEKAHPRVLDVFLQILDEGRLTDSRGTTAYFSEALIIFTSNIGIVQGSRATNMGMNVLPSDSYSELSLKIRRAVEEHFRNELKRPELLNRMGQNVVAFDFLKPEGMAAIFDALLDRVVRTVELEHGIDVTISDSARADLSQICTQDYFDGGRGIANRIETHFINPLARQMFLTGSVTNVGITGVELQNGRTSLIVGGPEPSAKGVQSDASIGDPPIKRPVRPLHPDLANDHWRKRFDGS